jgi:hypothetical protein
MVECIVQPFGHDIREGYSRLLPNQSGVNARGKLQWKFQNCSGDALAAVAKERDEVLGMSTYLPTALSIDVAPAKGYQAIDSIVSERARGKGIFTKLARTFSDDQERKGVDVVWGFPNANAAPAWFQKLQWTRLGTAPFLFKPLRAGYALRRFKLPLDFPLSALRDENAPQLREFDDSVNTLWQRLARETRCTVARDAQYLNWRLIRCPSATYRTVGLKQRDLTAFVSTHLAEKHGGYVGYIMEAAGGNELTALLRSEVGHLRERGAEVVLAWCFPWSPNYSAYRAAGFYSLPNALRPTEIHFGARAYSERGAAALDVRSWYLSYLDSDTV